VVPPSVEFVASFFGLLAIGASPTVLPLPRALQGGDDYMPHLTGIAATLRPRFCVASEANAAPLITAAASSGVELVHLDPAVPGTDEAVRYDPSKLAIMQFTSGSRGRPRGLRITWDNLEANLRMIQGWLETDHFGGVTWLPLYHDMGLVGGFLAALTAQLEHAVMRPEQFIRSTPGWLAEYGKAPYAHMFMPNFGFERVVDRVRPEDLIGLDFSGLTSVISGAERVNPDVLARFVRLLTPFGFDGRALMPAYGLAEGTLAVTGVPKRDTPPAVRVVGLDGNLGDPVVVLEEGHAGVDAVDEPTQWHVSCGRPLPGLEVELVDEQGNRLPDGRLGEIVVRGPSVADGYAQTDAESLTRFDNGWLHTGDAAFRHRGELYVIGRLGASVKIRGRRVFVEDIELKLADLTGAGTQRRLSVVAGMVEAIPTVLVLCEFDLTDHLDGVSEVVRGLAGDAARLVVLRLPRGRIPLTSSGKPRRRTAWLRYLAGELPGEELTVVDAAPLGVPG
jgi:acyl-CoA synthetase (AMP-forming)/AMP-acid ligase II